MAVVTLAILLACSSEVEEAPSSPVTTVDSDRAIALATRREDPRPSVVLFVIDTLRADAVSSYGDVEGTTPTFDRLAQNGIRYSRAYAPGPWTVPSHTTLFSGLRIDEHGIGLDGAQVTPDSVQMLAEDFREAGYLTAGFSENMLVSDVFGFDQGFDVFESTGIFEIREKIDAGEIPELFDLVKGLRKWNQLRDKSRPFFLFINILDAHSPFKVRDVNPWVPESVARDEAEFIEHRYLASTPLSRQCCSSRRKARDAPRDTRPGQRRRVAAHDCDVGPWRASGRESAHGAQVFGG
jgi:arylsulfatase A-like enzyme